MKISEVKKKFKNTWVLLEVLKKDKLNKPTEVKPIMESQDRNKLYERMAKVPNGKTVATLYTGKVSGTYLL